jgi:hypothetical protein
MLDVISGHHKVERIQLSVMRAIGKKEGKTTEQNRTKILPP